VHPLAWAPQPLQAMSLPLLPGLVLAPAPGQASALGLAPGPRPLLPLGPLEARRRCTWTRVRVWVWVTAQLQRRAWVWVQAPRTLPWLWRVRVERWWRWRRSQGLERTSAPARTGSPPPCRP
jgi:hypothetical protein